MNIEIGAQPAEYTWEPGKTSTYSVYPQHGVVKGKSSEEVKFRWRPNLLTTTTSSVSGGPSSTTAATGTSAATNVDAVFTLRVVGGSGEDKTVKCHGENPEGKCAFRDRFVDFKNVSLGVGQKYSLALRNIGNKDTIFNVEDNHNDMITVSPMHGPIAAGTTQTLLLCLDPTVVGALDSKLCVNIRGGKQLSIPLKANIIIPDISLKEDQYNFESVYMGGMSKRLCTLSNSSDIQVTLSVDFSMYLNFFLEISRDQWSTDDYDEVPLTNNNSSNPNMYTIVIAPHHELSFSIVFKPDAVTSYDFLMPVSVIGLPNVKKISKRIIAKALRPRMLINNPTVHFGSKIVLRERVKKIPYSMDLIMKNNDDVSFNWKLGQIKYESDSMRGSFDLEPLKGTLMEGEEISVKVTFLPRDSIAYKATVPVYLDGKEEYDYIIELIGAGTHPKIVCLEREVIMPPVPLGVTSTTTFSLLNQGYDNLDLQYKLPADSSNIPLELNFPEGQMIGIAKDKLRVEVSFCSSKAMSFTAQIVFLDEDGNRFPVQVSGVTDNSLLTTYPFYVVNRERIESALDVSTGPVVIDTSDSYLMPPIFTEDNSHSTISNNALPIDECINIIRFFNASTMMGPFENVVEAIVSSKGAVFIELLEFYSGKSVPGKMNKFSAQKKEQTEQLLQQYEKLLIFMKGHGALLNSLKPEYLVDVDDLRRIVSTKHQQAADEFELHHLEPWKQLEEKFSQVSRWAWSIMLQQLVKITILSRITPKQYAELPGINETVFTRDVSLSGSNVYSVHESILLKWMTHHFIKVFPRLAHRVTNFDEHLRSGLVIFSLLVSHWSGLKSFYSALRKQTKCSENDARNNALIILKAMRTLELPFPLNEEQLTSPDARDMLIFCLYLYQTLPQFKPIMSVAFNGKLGLTINKSIELSNPTNSVIAYNARLEGSSEFTISFKTILLEPKSTVTIPIACNARTSKTGEGYLILQSSREGGLYASTNVFHLFCEVEQGLPLLNVNISGSVYDLVTKDVEIKNPYPAECDFTIMILQGKDFPHSQDSGDGGKETALNGNNGGIISKISASTSKKSKKSREEMESKFRYPDPFGCDRRTMRIRKGDSGRITLFFLPFFLGYHKAHIKFSSQEFGHFVYCITGEATLPNPIAVHKFNIEPVGSTTKEVSINIQNGSLESAKRLFLDRHPLSRNQEQAELARATMSTTPVKYRVEKQSSYIYAPTEVTLYAGSSNAKAKRSENTAPADTNLGNNNNNLNNANSNVNTDNNHNDSEGNDKSDVHDKHDNTSNAPISNIANNLIGASNLMKNDNDTVNESSSGNILPITIDPKGPGVYPCRLVLTSTCDVRVIDVEFSAAQTAHIAELDFVCTAFQEIVQDIPLINSSEKPLAVRATILGKGFTGLKELNVDPFTTLHYTLHFKPTWVGEFEGELQLHIVTTGESSTYKLKGIADDPVAEGHVKISMAARETQTTIVNVPNVTGSDVVYSVYSDLPFLYGQGSIKVRKDGHIKFELGLRPPKSGHFRGSITFASTSGQYVWYTVDVNVIAPATLDTINVTSECRKASIINVELKNPLDYPMTFNVVVDGDGLVGSNTISLDANESGSYELLFCPLRSGSTKGSLIFISELLGEFAYNLSLGATAASAVKVEEIACELGDSESRIVQLTNPTRQKLSFTTSSSSKVFGVSPEDFTLDAFETKSLTINYTPSALDDLEKGKVYVKVLDTIDSDATESIIGGNSQDTSIAWEFEVSGRGTRPSKVESVCISAAVGETSSDMVTFKNPFPQPISVQFKLQPDPQNKDEMLHDPSSKTGNGNSDHENALESTFGIMIKRGNTNGVTVEPLGVLQIPIFFSPKRMEEKRAVLFVKTNNLSWRYQIIGQAETLTGTPIALITRSRQEITQEIEVSLPGTSDSFENDIEDFEVSVGGSGPQPDVVTTRNALAITPIRATKSTSSRPATLLLHVVFSPLRVMSTTADVIISSTKGGRWRQEFRLDATESETEGVVDVAAQVGTSGSASVTVHGNASIAVPFKAFFSPESAIELDVSPAHGILPANLDGPLHLNVTYTPIEYGRAATGLLIVETDEMQWSFQINGVRPEYIPPRGVSRLQNKPSEDAMKKLLHPRVPRNFVKENMLSYRPYPKP